MAIFGASIEILSNNLLANVVRIVESAEAKEKVYLISPYLQLNTTLQDVFDKSAKGGVDIRLIFRKDYELRVEDKKYLGTSNLQVRCLDHLHAKLYVSQSSALVTSLNLYNYSDKESRELGISITDSKNVQTLLEMADAWWDKADKVDKSELLVMGKPVSGSTSRVQQSGNGHCIRCGAAKTFNPKYPLCDSCYKDWAKFKNNDYEEKFCHRCGTKHASTVAKPLCRTCWTATNK